MPISIPTAILLYMSLGLAVYFLNLHTASVLSRRYCRDAGLVMLGFERKENHIHAYSHPRVAFFIVFYLAFGPVIAIEQAYTQIFHPHRG